MKFTGFDVLNKLCEAFGLPGSTCAVTLHADCKGLAVLTVEQRVSKEQVDKAALVLVTDYVLVDKTKKQEHKSQD